MKWSYVDSITISPQYASQKIFAVAANNNVPVNAEQGICRYAKDITSECKLLYVKNFP